MTVYIAADIHQQVFRVLLSALSNPGRMCPIVINGIHDHAGELLLATAQCLMDHEVTFAMAAPNFAELAQEIAQSTGAGEVPPQEADYVFVMDAVSNGLAARVKRGTLAYPDTGATIIYQLPALADSRASAGPLSPSLSLSGPGIRDTCSPEIPGLEIRELKLLGEVNHAYPQGVDAFFLFGNRAVMGLPRSTRIEVN
jgi:alpha-D-ribose 1-methylphosphonate 5-triphosphate synthase subunit PhnH